jgi:hypothetical protein
MRTTFTATTLAFPSIFAATILLTSCAASGAKKSGEMAIPVYETAEQIKAMPPCRATVVHIYPCYSLLKTTDGKQLYIGSPGATPEVGSFVGTLKEGKTYRFPGAFFMYQERQQQ